MGNDVCIIGAGVHPFGRWQDKTSATMARMAIDMALAPARIERREIEAVFCASVLPGSGGGTAVAQRNGLSRIPIVTVNTACSSSSTAITLAASSIASGQCSLALVVGFEKMNHGLIPTLRPHDPFGYYFGTSLQPARYALKGRHYLDYYGLPSTMLAEVAVKSRHCGELNPDAQFRSRVSLEDVLASRMIADPLTLFQCSPTSDGAAAVVLASSERAAKLDCPVVRLTWWGSASPYTDEPIEDPPGEELTSHLAVKGYEAAGVDPKDIGVVQVHDAFTSGELVRIEALGLCPPGEAAHWTREGRTQIGGRLPVNTDGGLLSRGHPLGATGAAQAREVYLQLVGLAGPRQVFPQPSVGLCQNFGGGENALDVVLLMTR